MISCPVMTTLRNYQAFHEVFPSNPDSHSAAQPQTPYRSTSGPLIASSAPIALQKSKWPRILWGFFGAASLNKAVSKALILLSSSLPPKSGFEIQSPIMTQMKLTPTAEITLSTMLLHKWLQPFPDALWLAHLTTYGRHCWTNEWLWSSRSWGAHGSLGIHWRLEQLGASTKRVTYSYQQEMGCLLTVMRHLKWSTWRYDKRSLAVQVHFIEVFEHEWISNVLRESKNIR